MQQKSIKFIIHFVTMFLVLTAAFSAAAASSSQSDRAPANSSINKVQVIENVTEYRLPNGLQILLIPDKSKTSIHTDMVYRVGSRNDREGEYGLAHLLEHMLYRPSLHFVGKDGRPTSIEELINSGIQFEGKTELDHTRYIAHLQAKPEILDSVLRLEAFRMANATFDAQILWDPSKNTGEKTVVRNELEIRENAPKVLLYEALFRSAFDRHSYRHLPIGNHHDIQAIQLARLKDFYKSYYRPDNASLIISGNFEPEQALQLIATHFKPIQKPTRPIQDIQHEEPPQSGKRVAELPRSNGPNVLAIAYHYPAIAHPDNLTLQVFTKIVTQERMRNFAFKHKLPYPASFDLEARITKDPSLMIFSLSFGKANSYQEIQNGFAQVIESFHESPLKKEEFDLGKSLVLDEFNAIRKDSLKLANKLAEYSAAADWRLFYLHINLLTKISLSQVQAAAIKYHQVTNRTIAKMFQTEHTALVHIPKASDIRVQLNSIQAGEKIEFEPATSTDFELLQKDIEYLNLDHGIKITLLPSKTRDQKLRISVRINFGNEQSLQNKSGQAPCGECYIPNFDAYEARKFKESLPSYTYHRSGTETYASFSVEAKGKINHLSQFLKLAASYFEAPSINPLAIEQYKKSRLNELNKFKADPERVALNTAAKFFDPTSTSHILHVWNFDELIQQLEQLNEKNAKAFYQQFYGPQSANVVVVGDFDPKVMRQELKLLFDGWQAASPYKRIPSQSKPAQAIDQTIQIDSSQNSFLLGYYPIALNDEAAEYPGLLVANWIFGGAQIQNRLMSRIRFQEGLSYAIGSQLEGAEIDKSTRWLIYANCAPKNLLSVKQLLKDELAKAAQFGFTQRELDDAKKSLSAALDMQTLDIADLGEKLLHYQVIGRTLNYDIQLRKKIESLTLEELNAAFKKHIDPQKFAYFSAGNFK